MRLCFFVWELIHVNTWKQIITEDYEIILHLHCLSGFIWLLSDDNTVSLFNFYFKSLSKKMIMYSIHIDRIVCFWGLHSHKGHRAQRANEGDVGCDLGWISPEPHQHAAKTNSRWWFASCLRSLWPASRQQPRDPQRSEGGAEESSGPPTGYKTRGRRKPSDCKHTWSKEAEREERKERQLESKRVKLLPPTGSSLCCRDWNRQI